MEQNREWNKGFCSPTPELLRSGCLGQGLDHWRGSKIFSLSTLCILSFRDGLTKEHQKNVCTLLEELDKSCSFTPLHILQLPCDCFCWPDAWSDPLPTLLPPNASIQTTTSLCFQSVQRYQDSQGRCLVKYLPLFILLSLAFSLDSFLSAFSQFFLYHIGPNEYTILRTGSPLMAIHRSYSTLKIKRHMKRAWEKKTQNICLLQWRNSWASTQGNILKWTYIQ